MKKTIAEFVTAGLLFGSFVFLFGAAGKVQAAAVAGASEAIVTMEYEAENDPWIEVSELYSSGLVNVRTGPDTSYDIYCTLVEYEPIRVWERAGSDWYRTKSGYYIRKDLLTDTVPDYKTYSLYSTFKSYTDYRALTAVDSPQWALQQRAYTGDYGIRMVSGRYCVALGSRFTTQIGQKFDIIFDDGTRLPCVLADQKSDRHTDGSNTYTVVNGTNCATEFYVDTRELYSKARTYGDMSQIPGWNHVVVGIVVYDSFI